ncbi:MAG TPA: helix-turn-helix domain-containing protein [Solirubrobacterales bacterium]
MERRIGAILRQARTRRDIELAEVEAATRIRLKYLRAIEAEDWDALPEGVYARGFIRTYASFLGLDGERLAVEYRREVEGGGSRSVEDGAAAPTVRPGPPRAARRARGLAWIAVVAVLAVAALVLAALPLGGGEEERTSSSRPGHGPTPARGASAPKHRLERAPAGVSMQLAATAEVWVCVLDAAGRPLVDGQILEGGVDEGPFRSGSFTVSLGNGEVTMLIDGREADIPATASPIGYSIDSSGELTELSEAERPTCT